MTETNTLTPAQEGTVPPTETPVEQASTEVHPQPDTPAETPDSARPRAQERIEELSARAKAGIEYGEFWRKRFEESQNQQQPAAQPAADPRPKRVDFDDDDAWADALTGWTERQAVTKAEAAAEARFAKAREEERLRTMQGTFQGRVAAFAKQNADYYEVVSNPTLPFNGQVLEALMGSDKGPEIAYHIAKSPELVAKLAGQSIPQRLATIGRLEAELSRPPAPPKQSAAPPPPNPIGAGPSAEKDPSKMTGDEWLAWRTAQLRANRAQRK